ncbi:MAG: hypothetical protein WB561_06455 [Terracidiphilus sp.]
MGELLQPWHLIVISFLIFPIVIIGLIPFWFICKKAGFSPWLTFLNLVPFPLGTLLLVYLLAFVKWKAIPTSTAAYPPPYPPQV